MGLGGGCKGLAGLNTIKMDREECVGSLLKTKLLLIIIPPHVEDWFSQYNCGEQNYFFCEFYINMWYE